MEAESRALRISLLQGILTVGETATQFVDTLRSSADRASAVAVITSRWQVTEIVADSLLRMPVELLFGREKRKGVERELAGLMRDEPGQLNSQISD